MDKSNMGEYWNGEHIDDLETQALIEYCEQHYAGANKCVCGEHEGEGITQVPIGDIDEFYAWEMAYIRGELKGTNAIGENYAQVDM